MKFITPEISWHNREAILSVDVQHKLLSSSATNCCYRLATCGNDTHLIVWKATVSDGNHVNTECLADLTRHQRSINVVRFSPNADDDLIAAGDDDCVIYIWKLYDDDVEMITTWSDSQANNNRTMRHNEEGVMIIDENTDANAVNAVNANGMEFDSEVISTELWKPYKILRGHIQDVTDVSWSPDGQMIASASVDNMCFVWNVHRGCKLFTIPNEHKGFVLGVSWDPLNQYLATLSNDRNMRIISCSTGKTKYRVCKTDHNGKSTRLFYDDTLRSFCRRLAFSPGGELLIAPSGILEMTDETEANNDDSNKYTNTSYVFERKSLNKPSFYLPSTKYTIAVKFCPQMFQLHDDIENPFKFPYRIVFAVASQDSVLFYDSQQTIPFAQVSRIHYLRLSDIAWSHDGRLLIISSTDGFATYVSFDRNELGIPYDGPKVDFREIEANSSPISNAKTAIKLNGKNETTPEAEKSLKKVSDPLTPSITSFFKPSNELSSPTISCVAGAQNQDNEVIQSLDIAVTPKRKAIDLKSEPFTPDLNSDTVNGKDDVTHEIDTKIKKITSFFKPSVMSKLHKNDSFNDTNATIESNNKRKEIIVDLTEDSEDNQPIEPIAKRPNCSSSPAKHSHTNGERATVSPSILLAPANCKIKDNSVRNLVDKFKALSNDVTQNTNVNMDTNSDVCSTTNGHISETPNNTISCSSTSIETVKQPRRIQFTTLTKK